MHKSVLAAGLLACGLAQAAASPKAIQLTPLGSYTSGLFGQSAAEIVAHDPVSQRLFVVNAASGLIDVLDIREPSRPTLLFNLDLSAHGGAVNSVAVRDGLIAAAVENRVKTEPGRAVFLDRDGQVLASVQVGALPDMLVFTPDGKHLLVANEGEPSDDYLTDPEGSVSIVELPKDIAKLTQAQVRTADFRAFSRADLDPSVRIFGPNASVAQDLEPEYISVAHDSRTAWVTLQENNAVAVLGIKRGQFRAIRGLGFKDHSLAGNELDASDRDNQINIRNWPVLGMYQPDAIASYQYRGRTYLVTANEGDARDYPGFSEEVRLGSANYPLSPLHFPDAASLKQNANLGRLTVSSASGYNPASGYYEAIHAFGGRSFSIWSEDLTQVYDSGADFERITAAANPQFFNSDHASNSFDNRSDNKGPEPEGVTLAKLWGKTHAFIGLERIGGVMVYDISQPQAPQFVQYFNNRDFATTPGSATAGDLGPEGLMVIEAEHSPIGVPLLVVGNEVSGTTSLFRIDRQHR
ncbi:alkaline phosphatase [Pseudomonas sp. AOB-7]|uniref:choice-of-anchor I family protein n=1 Tax=Pseudomonas sp. AOB-7 TaxID=2482750 RepID=UPI000EFB5E1E|nr:choice-of-anchor I family protein [Pseudomonas sp. AOB-7]RMH83309.1 alkaline phosphatase [Pseudomonas sp. AOB-7]